MSSLKKTVGGIILAVVLTIVIVFEFKAGFDMVHNRQMSEINTFIQSASEYGKASVSIDEVAVYDEIPAVSETGYVVAVPTYDFRIKLNGELSDDSNEETGVYNYVSNETHTQQALYVSKVEADVTGFRNALKSFWFGDTTALPAYAFSGSVPEDVQFFQCTYRGGNVPVLYSESQSSYVMLISCEGEYFLQLTSAEQFALTDDLVTVAFGDPMANPQSFHTYSKYEEQATTNTLRELKEKEENGDSGEATPYTTSEVPGTSTTYTSKADDTKREQMSSMSKFAWKKDGTSKDTDLKVDITSEEANKSKWVLTETTYSYEANGLKLYALSGSRSAETFSIEGTIQNMLNAERPYVLIIKYLDTNNELLGISVVDKRTAPLKPEGVDKFSMSVVPAKDKIDIQRIASMMFEVY